ncbi:MAG: PhnD/SsuA/transferrin family substrate-binding protein [Deltaproteobacteria bacterium]|nr:PhnD/SsuA/transferrin family substrate-binding protein [Deltaproteobacteria bacterium]
MQKNTVTHFLTPALLLLFVLLLDAFTGHAAENQKVAMPEMFRVGFSSKLFSDVDQNDARIAMDLWAKELMKNTGIKGSPEAVIFDNLDELLNAVKKGELSIVTLSALEYLQIRNNAPMMPAFVTESEGGIGHRYVLIANRESGVRSVADLRNKSISLNSSKRTEASLVWLDVLILKAGYRDRLTYFSQIKKSTSSKSIMAVFFRQLDAAVIRRESLETSIMLNPQIGKQIAILAESESLAGGISCIPTNVDKKDKHIIESTAFHLHETTVGKQILTLFQTGRIIPFNQSFLDGTMELLQERNELLTKQKRKP